MRFVVQRIRLGFVPGLILEAFVSRAHAVIGNQGLDVLLGQRLQVGFTVVTRVRCVEGIRRGLGPGGGDHAEQQFLFAAGAMCLGVDDDLVRGIDRSHAAIALNHALAGRHLRTLAIGTVR